MSEAKVWKPFQKQQDFLRIPDDIDEALYGGSVYTGKTELLIYTPVIKEFHLEPRFHGIIFRRTFPELEQSIIPRAYEIYPHFGGKYNSQYHFWKFPSGAIIRFGYMERKEDVVAHDTAQYSYIGWEELTAMEEYQYYYMKSRCRRPPNTRLPFFMRAATNPLGIGHAWVRKRFVDPCPEGYRLIKEYLGKGPDGKDYYTTRIYIHAVVTDNPYVDPQYIASLLNLPEAEKQAKLYGNWYVTAGEVFPEFRVTRHSDEPENAVHVIEPFTIPDWWPKFIAIDWGWQAMTYVIWAALSPDGRLYIYRELPRYKTNIATWAAEVARLSEYDGNIVDVVIDPSSNMKRGQQTIFELFVEHSQFDQARLADNDRKTGKALVHEFLRWKEAPSISTPNQNYDPEMALRILRQRGVKALERYQTSFVPNPLPETNIPRLQIFNTCPVLIETIPACTVDKHDNEDVEEFFGDDPYDTLRYLLKAVKPYEMSDRSPYDIRHQKIMQEFSKNQDQTYLHMQMAQLEYDKRRKTKTIKRFHRGQRIH